MFSLQIIVVRVSTVALLATGFVAILLSVPRVTRSQGAIPSAPSSSPPTPVGVDQINELAGRLADAISRSKNDSVIVFDFVGRDRKLTSLGAILADDLGMALAASPEKLHVYDHSHLKKLMADNGLESEHVFDPGVAAWLTQDIGAQALVLGQLGIDTATVQLSVTSYGARDGRGIAGFKLTLPLTDEMKQLIPESLQNVAPTAFVSPEGKCVVVSSQPCGGANGYSSPKCLRCPQPQYSEEAKSRRTEGTTLLTVIVDVNGKAEDIRVVRALPYGLTRQAIQAIQKWTFQPAAGPDGKAVAVRQPIEVSFHLF